MKKLLVLFAVSFIAIIIALSVLSKVDNTYSKIENNTFHKITKSYDIKVTDNMVKVKNIVGEDKEGILLFISWPWLPLGQFEKYKKFFIVGSSFENTYNY